CWEFLTFLNYTASAYPDASWSAHALSQKEREEILDFSFRHWKRHSPYLKAMLALTLKRMGRPQDAELVFASVMDSARRAIRISAPARRPRTAPGSGTTTRSRRTLSRCGPSPS